MKLVALFAVQLAASAITAVATDANACTWHSDCPRGLKKCNSGMCKECTSNEHCRKDGMPGQNICNDYNRCVECKNHGNCADNTGSGKCYCNKDVYKCVECAENSHCVDNTLVNEGETLLKCNKEVDNGVCVKCSKNSHCRDNDTNLVCDTGHMNGECVTCTKNRHCTEDGLTKCDTVAQECVQCKRDGHCLGREDGLTKCNTVEQECVAPSPLQSPTTNTAFPSAVPSAASIGVTFTPGDLEVGLSARQTIDIIKKLDGNMDGRFATSNNRILQETDCDVLKKHCDGRLTEIMEQQGISAQNGKWYDLNITEDLRLTATPAELENLIGLDSIRALYWEFKAYDDTFPVNKIVLRRTTLYNKKHIEFHTDPNVSFMFVWLNADEIEGGGPVYLTGDRVTPTKPVTGAGLFQSENVVHGISPFIGTRYILGFLGESVDSVDILKDMISVSNTKKFVAMEEL